MDGRPAIAGCSGMSLKPDCSKIAVIRFTNTDKPPPQGKAGCINGETPATGHGTGLP